ncbi:DUF2690 domain-containing protein [Streptomyces sp. TRM 70351]|uniref:DUF2690 domain-containing protein n=1 Tax=Streptomyces sp. TRM 70351 TaxID=3116552 RepID=UPI002E7B2F21|nr:DUF2690 domain-containing protein [Streptomyces sp. TRM 70351]MEE1927963.1 DUF2690 domain-containing protein [Streptomyces sp. TRM 70351]
MPRWKALPQELEPEVRALAAGLRRAVDGGGTGLAALAERTGYSRTSWERYLDGELLPPQGAVSALAEATGSDVRYLATLWESAERAWSRAGIRHDQTMEAIRNSQARQVVRAAKEKRTQARNRPRGAAGTAAALPPAPHPAPVRPAAPGPGRVPGGDADGAAGDGADGTVTLRRRPPAAAPTAPASAARPVAPRRPAPRAGGPRPAVRPSRARRLAMLTAGGVGALVVLAAAYLFVDLPGGGREAAAGPTSGPTATAAPKLPAGVTCTGADCTGKDPERAGCSGQHAETVKDAMLGAAYVEVRYSEVCAAAWARVAGAQPGDTVRITADGNASAAEDVAADSTGGYTMMVAAERPGSARICLERAGEPQGCTLP